MSLSFLICKLKIITATATGAYSGSRLGQCVMASPCFALLNLLSDTWSVGEEKNIAVEPVWSDREEILI